LIGDLCTSPRLLGVERVRLPGAQSHAKLLDRRANGVPMPKSLRDTLDAVARDLGVAGVE
jgi:LDH2 family malate/lactate/ureidoglycolate dehydrogenase